MNRARNLRACVNIDWCVRGVFHIFTLCFPSPRRPSPGQFFPSILSLPTQKMMLVRRAQEQPLIANTFYDTLLPCFKVGKCINGSSFLIFPFKHLNRTDSVLQTPGCCHSLQSDTYFAFSCPSPQTVKSFLLTACGPAPSPPSAGHRCGGRQRTRASRSACVTSTCRRRAST